MIMYLKCAVSDSVYTPRSRGTDICIHQPRWYMRDIRNTSKKLATLFHLVICAEIHVEFLSSLLRCAGRRYSSGSWIPFHCPLYIHLKCYSWMPVSFNPFLAMILSAVLCPNTPVLAHAAPVDVDLRPGSNVTYLCNRGYAFVDGTFSKTITCIYYSWFPAISDCTGKYIMFRYIILWITDPCMICL